MINKTSEDQIYITPEDLVFHFVGCINCKRTMPFFTVESSMKCIYYKYKELAEMIIELKKQIDESRSDKQIL